MIIYAGDRAAGNFIYEVAKKRNIEVNHIEENIDIKKQENDILFQLSKAKYLVTDIEQYINEADEIVESLDAIKKLGAKIIVLTSSLSSDNLLISKLVDIDIKNFISKADNLSSMKNELEKNLTDYYDINERKEIEEIKSLKKATLLKDEKTTTIALAGSINRIGTTTQALQIVKYLIYKGYKACYIEVNNNVYENNTLSQEKEPLTYTRKLKKILSLNEDEGINMIKYEGIELYNNIDKLADIKDRDYDFIVFDYGCYKNNSFNKASFLKDDINILICGSEITEIDEAAALASNISYEKSKLVFSFTDKSDEDDIISLISSIKIKENEENGARCYFANFTPSPFKLSSIDLYDSLLDIKATEDSLALSKAKEKTRSKKLFKFGGKKWINTKFTKRI